MGTVFEAEHLDTERRVALKVLLPQSLVSENARERFKQEARVAGRLRHPNIVDVLDAGVDDITGMPYLVMELLQGEDLGSRIEHVGPLPPSDAVSLLVQLAAALDCLHERSIVHRDLKPENVFLTWAEDGSPVLKLLDFGVAKVIAEGKTSAFTQDAQGTPAYMAPEQFAEQIRISPATDIYALGMVAYTLLTGRHYWGAEVERGMNVFMLARIAEGGPKEPASVRAGRAGASLSASFDEWFSTVTALVPGERYPTATVAIELLAEALGVEIVQAPVRSNRASIHLAPDVRSVRPPAEGPPSGAPTTPRHPSPERCATPVSGRDRPLVAGNTPPIPLQRARPFWRQPTVMTSALLGLAAALTLALALAPWAHVGPGSMPTSVSTLDGLTSAEPAPSPSPSPSPGAEPPPSPSTRSTSAPSPTTSFSAAPAALPSASASAVAPPPFFGKQNVASSRQTPVTPAPPTASKRPKYTRE